MSDVLTVDLNGVRVGEIDAPRVESLGPGMGYVVHHTDGTTKETPAAKKTLAARRREKLISTDVSSVAPYAADADFYIVTWGRNDRAKVRGDMARMANGELIPSETELGDAERFMLAALVNGVKDDCGFPAFTVEDALAYDKDSEDAEFLGGILDAIISANPLFFPPADEKKIAEAAD